MSRETAFNSIFASNGQRLSWRQWIGVALTMILFLWFAPSTWSILEPFEPGNNYRVPAELGNDYWHVQRWIDEAATAYPVVAVGDSVVWGEYVKPDATLTAHLNDRLGRAVCANGALGGLHPAALKGLLEHYGGGIRDTRVLLQWNLLWMSRPHTDLRLPETGAEADEDADIRINHPALIPQFDSGITGYDARIEERLDVVVKHRLPLFQLMQHIRTVYFGGSDLQRWTMQHPTANLLIEVTGELPQAADAPHSRPAPWFERGLKKQDYAWVDPAESVQWKAFVDLVRLLRARGNDLYVIVGPMNTHMVTDASRERYGTLKQHATDWLAREGVPFVNPPTLPSALYCDASHPLAAGYAREVDALLSDPAFREWLTQH